MSRRRALPGLATRHVAGSHQLTAPEVVLMKIAILGWGSLLWEGGVDFDRWHDEWRYDSPSGLWTIPGASAKALTSTLRRTWRPDHAATPRTPCSRFGARRRVA